jgi:hypothetical protein
MKLGHAEFVDFANMFQLARRFWHYLAPLRLWIAVSVALSVALPLIGGAILWLVKEFVDKSSTKIGSASCRCSPPASSWRRWRRS